MSTEPGVSRAKEETPIIYSLQTLQDIFKAN